MWRVLLVLLLACGSEEKPVARNDLPVAENRRSDESWLEPIIGTRDEEGGVLTPTLEVDASELRYAGCDLRFAGVPPGSQVELVWLFKPADHISERARVIHQAWYRLEPGDQPRAWVDPERRDGHTEVGSYECVWTLGGRGVSARLRVRAKT